MIPVIENAVRHALAFAIRESVMDGTMKPAHWADIFRYVTGDTTPVMQMREGVAQKVLDFWNLENRKERLN